MAQSDQEPKIGSLRSAWINARETIRDGAWAAREAFKDFRETGSVEIAVTTYKAAQAHTTDMRDRAEMHASGDLVRTTGSMEWHIHDGGGTESKVVFGESDHGKHYMLLTSERGGEADGAWSKPFPTTEAARDAGISAQWQATTTGFGLPDRADGPPGAERPPHVGQDAADPWASRDQAGATARSEATTRSAERQGPRMGA